MAIIILKGATKERQKNDFARPFVYFLLAKMLFI